MCALHPDNRRSGLADLIVLQVEAVMESVTNSSVILLLTKMKDKKQTNIVYNRTWDFSKFYNKILEITEDVIMSTSSLATPVMLARKGGEKWEVARFGSVCGETNNVVGHFCVLFSIPLEIMRQIKNKNKKERNQENLSVGFCCSSS